MTKTPLEDFLNECVAPDPDGDGLSMDELYGLYLSWCGLEGLDPVRARAFRAGLRAAKIRTEQHGNRYPGLRMAGPAACDYLVHRELPLVVLDASAGHLSLAPPPVPELAAPLPGLPGAEDRGSVPAA